ncbi:hypothetical protein ACFXKG_30735 [Streptomyces sp. NPDC059255]|uniref:hypothetical protein n=1 Tax=Streptomyces sp. NPDC059255 TaxID=3346793 RepID=UPI0036B082F7
MDARQRRVEPYIWEWTEDGIKRQAVVHYTRFGTTVIYAPRYPGDELAWFDADYPAEGDQGRYEDVDIVTLGSPDRPGYGLVDPDDDIDAVDTSTDDLDVATQHPAPQPPEKGSRRMPLTKIPDVVNHRSLLTALNSIRAEVESRQEDVNNLAAWSTEMAERMRGATGELTVLNVDTYTVGNVTMLGDLLGGQKLAAAQYKNATDTSVTQAESAARTAHRNHGRIQDAVDEADVPMATNTFYDADE